MSENVVENDKKIIWSVWFNKLLLQKTKRQRQRERERGKNESKFQYLIGGKCNEYLKCQQGSWKIMKCLPGYALGWIFLFLLKMKKLIFLF